MRSPALGMARLALLLLLACKGERNGQSGRVPSPLILSIMRTTKELVEAWGMRPSISTCLSGTREARWRDSQSLCRRERGQHGYEEQDEDAEHGCDATAMFDIVAAAVCCMLYAQLS